MIDSLINRALIIGNSTFYVPAESVDYTFRSPNNSIAAHPFSRANVLDSSMRRFIVFRYRYSENIGKSSVKVGRIFPTTIVKNETKRREGDRFSKKRATHPSTRCVRIYIRRYLIVVLRYQNQGTRCVAMPVLKTAHPGGSVSWIKRNARALCTVHRVAESTRVCQEITERDPYP